ncbi:MAG: response regulator [Kofleriaceae bacterium]
MRRRPKRAYLQTNYQRGWVSRVSITAGPVTALRLLVAEDSADDYELLLRELRRGGYAVIAERVTSAEALAAALERPWDLIVSDWIMPGFSGRAVLEMLAARRIIVPCIVASGTPSEEAAVQSLRLGALDFLSKDKPRRLVPAVQRALREAADHRAREVVELELKLSEERYRTGFEVAPEALLTYDLDTHKIIDANSNAQRLFRRTLDQLRTSRMFEFSAPLQPDGRPIDEVAPEAIGRALAGESPTLPWRLLIDGEEIPAEMQVVHLPTKTGRLVRVGITDLRERIRTEEIRRRGTELEQQNRRIQEASRLKSEFLANMSHELRTPLNAIIGFAELLYDGQVPTASPQHNEFLGDILASGRHLLQLINDVLDLSKVEAGKLEFRPEIVELANVLGEVTTILRTTAAHKRLRIEVEIDPTLGELLIDPGRLKQVTYNYLSNALKFTPAGGRITVRAKPEGEHQFRLEVEDTGVGIAPTDLSRLFVEFEQLEVGAAKRHQGTGLGLALTRRLVEAQGGSVGVRSQLGAGTTFHAVLPRRAIAVAALAIPRTVTRDGANTVLVVEDDVRDQAQLVATLASAGYSVEIAVTGAEALERWRARRFDAVTIDLLLPDMSGLELLAALQREPGGLNLRVPIIVVTVVPDVNVVAGFSVHDILRKPLDRESLLASLVRAGVQGSKEGKA